MNKKKIVIFLFDGIELLELSPFTDIFGWNEVVGTKDTEIITVSYKNKVKCSWGGEFVTNKIITDENLESIMENCEALVVPGGFGKANFFVEKNNLIFKKIVKKAYLKNIFIVAICTAVINLLEANVFKEKKLTTYLLENKRYFNQLYNYNVFPKEEEIVIDHKLITCSGPGNATEVAFILLEKLTSCENRKKVEKNMMFRNK